MPSTHPALQLLVCALTHDQPHFVGHMLHKFLQLGLVLQAVQEHSSGVVRSAQLRIPVSTIGRHS